MNEEKLNQLLGKVVIEMGAAAIGPLVIIGDKLGLYTHLAASDQMGADELAAQTNTSLRYVEEWLAAQAASGYIEYDAEQHQFFMTAEQKAVFADARSPVFMTGAFYSVTSLYHDEPKLLEAFQTGKGISWGNHHTCLFCGTEKFFSPSYEGSLVNEWIPSITGLNNKLTEGALVADIGCGHAASTIIMAKAYPNSHFVGIDFHKESIDVARQRALKAEVSNIEFKVATAKDFAGRGFDLITFFDCLHDMGDPVGACQHAKSALKEDGCCMIVEPFAHDALRDNLNPVGRAFYAFSTQICVPCSLQQEVGLSLGAQAGLSRLKETIQAAGFGYCEKSAETPFNLILEARV